MTDHASCDVCECLLVTTKAKGDVCPACCPDPSVLVGAGWMSGVGVVAIKPYKEEVRAVLDHLLSRDVLGQPGKGWEPIVTKDGAATNREAWHGQWHVGIHEKLDADGATVFLGAAEDARRRLKVRLPSAWVARIRQVVCPEAPGRSE